MCFKLKQTTSTLQYKNGYFPDKTAVDIRNWVRIRNRRSVGMWCVTWLGLHGLERRPHTQTSACHQACLIRSATWTWASIGRRRSSSVDIVLITHGGTGMIINDILLYSVRHYTICALIFRHGQLCVKREIQSGDMNTSPTTARVQSCFEISK